MRVAIVACGSSKQDEDSPAGEMYVSDYARKMAQVAENHFNEWYILSAFYGLIPSSMVITPYNVSIDQVNQTVWLSQVIRNIRRYDLDQEDVDVWTLAPKTYQEAGPPDGQNLREVLEGLTSTTVFPYDATSGIGYQKAWLKDTLEDGELVHPREGAYE